MRFFRCQPDAPPSVIVLTCTRWFSALNHFTVPVTIAALLLSLRRTDTVTFEPYLSAREYHAIFPVSTRRPAERDCIDLHAMACYIVKKIAYALI